MRIRRFCPVVLLIAALAPGLWWRSSATWPAENGFERLIVRPLAGGTPSSWPSGLQLAGAWQLTSANSRFGGYSALLADSDDTLTAISDYGKSLRFRRPDRPGAPEPRFEQVGSRRGLRFWPDIEAATQDLETGTRWVAYEKSNRIRRFAKGDARGVAVSPPAMRDWARNGGAESMARLADGRFIVLAEDAPWLSAGGRAGLLFPFDPVDGAKPLEFTFRPPIGYSPSDMAALPDGRVVILLRAVDPPFPPFFRTMLVTADPADIAGGETWPWHKLADLAAPLPRDNFEGLATAPEGDGVTMWLISDDNFARFQRTLLLKLHWQIPPRGAATK
jgi:hypothetical protein